jgi:hypothetical protein
MQLIVAALAAALLGTLLYFLGYRIFLVLLPVWGFFAGLWFGLEVVRLIMGKGFFATSAGFIAGFAIGILVAALSYLIFELGVGMVAAGFGIIIGSGLMEALFGLRGGILVLVAALGLGAIVGLLTIKYSLQRYVIMVVTSLAGASLILLAVLLLLNQASLDTVKQIGNSIQVVHNVSPLWSVVWLFLSALGVWVQIRINKNFRFVKDMYLSGWG